MGKLLDPIPPGEILLEEYMKPLNITQRQLAADIDIPISRISDIVHAKRGITADTALRLGEYFDTGAKFWMNLQAEYDLQLARQNDTWSRVKKRINAIKLIAQPSY